MYNSRLKGKIAKPQFLNVSREVVGGMRGLKFRPDKSGRACKYMRVPG